MMGATRAIRAIAASALAASAACSAVAPSGSASATATARHAWTVPDTLRVVSGNVPRTLNPLLATQTVESSLGRLTNDILVSVDERGNFVPRLAQVVPTLANGGISPDGLTVTYRLRHGVRWHDGAAFTSRDVKFTFDAIMNRDNDVISRHGYDEVDRVMVPDPSTIVFHLRRRFAPFVATVFGESDSPYGILPAHLLAREKTLNNAAFNSAPVGTGPFRFVRWVRGDRIEFVRNDDYFLGPPKIRRIVWRLVPDENTELTLLRTHEADWMFEASVTAYKALKTFPDTTIALTVVNGFQGVMMNAARAPTSDVRIRRAIAMLLDKARLTGELTYGAAIAATGDLPSFMWAYDPQLRSLPYDPDAARRLLAAAGYGPKHRLALDLVFEQSQAVNRSLVVQIQSALHDVAIDVHPRAQLSSVIYGGYGAGGTLATGHYQLSLYQWFAGIDPDDSAQLACANRPPNGFNQAFYCAPAMDAAQAIALGAYDRPTRKAAYAQIERLVVGDAPIDILWWMRNVQAVNPDLHGFDPNPVTETWDIRTWSI